MTEPFLSMKMRGLDELVRVLKEMPDKTRAKISRQALRQSAELMKQEVIARTPRKDGFLQASIRTKVQVGVNFERALIIAGDARAWYAHLMEYGFVHTGHGKKKKERKPTSRGKVEGKAFLRGAAEAKFEPTVDLFEKTVGEVIEKEASKLKG